MYSGSHSLVDLVVGFDWIGAFRAVVPDMYSSAFVAYENEIDRTSPCVTLSILVAPHKNVLRQH